MLKKQFRLNVKQYYSSHTPITNRTASFFRLRFSQNGLGYNRYGFVVSKRVDKTAVGRNRAKRLLRGCIENLSEQMKPGYDMLFIIQKQFIHDESITICNEVKSVLEKELIL